MSQNGKAHASAIPDGDHKWSYPVSLKRGEYELAGSGDRRSFESGRVREAEFAGLRGDNGFHPLGRDGTLA